MPSPIGHSMAGVIIYALATKGKCLFKSWRWVLLCTLFAALPDVDYVPALFGKLDLANNIHRHVTHTLLFAIVVWAAALGALKILRKRHALRDSIVLFLCSASHLFLDLFAKDLRPPIGIPLLWPLVGRSFKFPVDFFSDLHKSTYAEVFSVHNLAAVAYELLLFGSILLVVVLVKLRRARKNGKVQAPLGQQPGEERHEVC